MHVVQITPAYSLPSPPKVRLLCTMP
jgi:hypothetical protein